MYVSVTLVEIPSQKAVMGASFTPILGQYGIGIREFCNLFNNKTINFCEGIPLNLTVNASGRDRFVFQKLKISPTILVRLLANKIKVLSLRQIYLIFCIMHRFDALPQKIVIKSIFKTYMAYIRSFGIRIIN